MSDIQNIFEVLKAVIVESLAPNSWVGMWHLAALASVSQKTVMSIYPAERVGIATTSMVRTVLNRLVYPRIVGLSANTDFIPIMWTSSVLPSTALWRPNHFVLCVTRPQTQPGQISVHKPHVNITLPKVVAPITTEETSSTVVNRDQNMTKYQKRKLKETPGQRDLRLAKRRRLYALKKQKIYNQKHEQSVKHIKQGNTETTQKQEVSHENASYIYEDRTKFIEYISQYPKNHCHYCKRKLFPSEEKKHLSKSGENTILCGKCQSSLSRNEVPTLTYQNKLDPGQIPIELSNLNMMEKRLISQIHLYVTIVTLPGGQLGEKGQAIHFPIDVPKQWKSLPIPATESDVILVKNNSKTATYPVSYSKVYEALQWLQKHNHLYKDVFVDYKHKSIETTRQPIPELILESSTTQHQKIVPNISKPSMLNDKQQDTTTNSHPVYTLPSPNDKPVDILGLSLETPLEELAFPWLFPFGANGFTSQRDKKLTDLAYFQSRLMNHDARFSADIPYLFFANSIYEARKLSSCISIALRMKTICSSDKQHKLQAKDLRGKINADIIEDSYVFMRNIRGTPAYWRNELLNLLARIGTLGPPTWFITLSAADLQWEELYTMLSPKKKLY